MTNWTEIDEIAKKWVREAGSRIKQSMHENLTIETKSNPNDLVTNIDKETEKFFIDRIQETFPGHRILGEEGQGDELHSLDGVVWIIDPIDGTMNFVHQQRHFAISIGIFENGKGKIGLIYDVVHDELYHAFSGKGAYMNETKLVPLQETSIEEAILAINATWVTENRRIDPSVLAPLVKRVRGTRSYGSAALELANVAAGRIDAYITMRLAPWDYAAGCILLNEVGGLYTTIDGESFTFLENHSVLAGNPSIHRTIFEEYLHAGK
ncbi:inositol-1-monophosphatase [Bacillus atrophaeus]|uniref:inositol-phosphate phosphatase n=1 Tax=Bacillus atrophaeus (strain 1942) TaxID=720555 RepID=A0ABM5LVY5_BACA1|nr:inositol-1-monophosphatase [Bacillus atrophaeus]AMR63109.1 inositol monophosphatase [Bacillus subtilis subsp. globigii]ADP31976.1 inositol monophosphatase [Bacillus atrophaeus 1942]AIK47542.1 inositol monophosphatase family protein [Bacillus atrophaeus subsp. globigii]EIM08646.1 inositol monophosphatase [Bacillus atrophaeus C89]KFK82199.1 inositol monophosphatase family protein [Bacillus atrophaeus]